MDKKLNPLAAGLAFGIYFGVGLFIVGLLAWLTGYCKIFVSFMSTFYIGYTYTFLGSLMGLVWGFVDGFVGAYIIVRLYGLISKKGNKFYGCIFAYEEITFYITHSCITLFILMFNSYAKRRLRHRRFLSTPYDKRSAKYFDRCKSVNMRYH